MSRELGLTLFGIDIIQDAGEHAPHFHPRTGMVPELTCFPANSGASGGVLYAIDVNYFPGYDGVHAFHDKLAEHIKSEAAKAARR